MNCSLFVVRGEALRTTLFCFASCLALFSFVGISHANTLDASVCAKLAQGKAYKEASSCFLRIANTMNKPKLSPVERKLKGLYLTNAAKLMQRTAKLQTKAELKAYYYEQAATMYKSYLKQRLCTQKYRCQEIRGKLYELTKAIGYSQLTIVVSAGAKGKLSFQGFKYEKVLNFPPNISMKLRPGKYRLIVEYSDKRTKILNVTLLSGKNKIMTLKGTKKAVVTTVRVPPPPKPKAKPAVWPFVVLGVAGAAAIASVVFMGVGAAAAAEAVEVRDEFLEDSSKTSPDKTVFDEKRISDEHGHILQAHEDAGTMFVVGWVFGGVAAAALTVGIIGIVASKPKPPPPADMALEVTSKTTRLAREIFTF